MIEFFVHISTRILKGHFDLTRPTRAAARNWRWKRRTLGELEEENFHSVVRLEKRVRQDQRDDFGLAISRIPAAFCQQKLVFPMHPNFPGWKNYKRYRQIVTIWMLFLELMYFWHLCRNSHLVVVVAFPWDFLLP